jgi:NADH/F420H2 dehydrogenase subunit C
MSSEVQTQVEQTHPPGEYGKFLKEKGIDSTPLGNDVGGVEMFEVKAVDLEKLCVILKDLPGIGFDFLALLTALEIKNGYQAIYSLHSTKTKKSIRIKVTVSKDNPELPSVSHIWSTADWYEREAFDMIGIKFTGHPNLKRILNPENWEGFPLRKDYIPPSDMLNGPHPLTESKWAEKTLSSPSKEI